MKRLDQLFESLKFEDVFEAEKRLEKQRFENFVPLKDRRPEHEFFDLENIYS